MRESILAIAVLSGQVVDQPRTDDAAQIGALGITAYERGDYRAALYLLRTAISAGTSRAGSVGGVDSWSAVYLSRMYLLGESTPRDTPLACARFRAAVTASDVQTRDVNAASKFRRVIGQDPCGSTDDRFQAEVHALLTAASWGESANPALI